MKMFAADIVVPVVLERQSDIWQQHFKVLKLLIPIYSFTFCDIMGCNRACLSRNPAELMLMLAKILTQATLSYYFTIISTLK